MGYFVTFEQLKAYKAEEIVPDPLTGKAKKYERGSFLYRLAGRNRQKSASYYTPEVLPAARSHTRSKKRWWAGAPPRSWS